MSHSGKRLNLGKKNLGLGRIWLRNIIDCILKRKKTTAVLKISRSFLLIRLLFEKAFQAHTPSPSGANNNAFNGRYALNAFYRRFHYLRGFFFTGNTLSTIARHNFYILIFNYFFQIATYLPYMPRLAHYEAADD